MTKRRRPLGPARTQRRTPANKPAKPKPKPIPKEVPIVIVDDVPEMKKKVVARKVVKQKAPMAVHSMFYGYAQVSAPTISIHNYNPNWNL